MDTGELKLIFDGAQNEGHHSEVKGVEKPRSRDDRKQPALVPGHGQPLEARRHVGDG
ncbi:hypothetical protein D3C87_1658820 [compost metagenome]